MNKNDDKTNIRNEPNVIINSKKAFDLSINIEIPGYSEPDKYVPEIDKNYHFDEDNFIIIDKGRSEEEKSVVLVNKGQYLGYGYLDSSEVIEDPDQLYNFIDVKRDNKDTRQIIRTYLKKNKVEKLIRF